MKSSLLMYSVKKVFTKVVTELTEHQVNWILYYKLFCRYGLQEFIVITPADRNKAIDSESRAKVLLSSVSVALTNSSRQFIFLFSAKWNILTFHMKLPPLGFWQCLPWSAGGHGFENQSRSNQRLQDCYLLLLGSVRSI